jgi:membrane protease YdiL (CAAX protease family)
MQNKKMFQLAEVLVITLLLAVFAFFIHYPFPEQLLAFGTAGVAAFIISRHIQYPFQFAKFLGNLNFSKRMIIACSCGLLAGIILALFYRYRLVITFIPKTIHNFIWVAAVIGISEELIFRGFIQGHLSGFPTWVAISITSFSHSVYKCFIFLAPVIGHSINIPFLFTFTFAGGLFFGWLKEYGRSTIPPAIAHAAFDIIAYAEYINAPWWVW